MKKLLLSLLLILPLNLQAAKPTYGPYQAAVINVINGSTVELNVHLWPGLKQRVKFRLQGIRVPIKHGKKVAECEKKAAQKALDFTKKWLKNIKQVRLSQVKLGKFSGLVRGRLAVKGEYLGEALIKAGHAKPMSLGKKEPWC